MVSSNPAALERLLSRAKGSPYYERIWRTFDIQKFDRLPPSDEDIFKYYSMSAINNDKSSEIAMIFFSGGTTHTPKLIPFSLNEWHARANYRARMYQNIGVSNDTTVAVMLPFGPWVAGPSAQAALAKIGCEIYPLGLVSSAAKAEHLLSLINDQKIDALVTIPSTLEFLLDAAVKSIAPFRPRTIITSGEVLSPKLRNEMREIFDARCYSCYASTEAFIGIECDTQHGFHYDPQEVLIELVGPPNRIGGRKALITVLRSEIVPLIRYALGDYLCLDFTPCDCGLSLPRAIWAGRQKGEIELAGGINVSTSEIAASVFNAVPQTRDVKIWLRTVSPGRDLLHVVLALSSGFEGEFVDLRRAAMQAIQECSLDLNDGLSQGQVVLDVEIHASLAPAEGKRKVRLYDRRQVVR